MPRGREIESTEKKIRIGQSSYVILPIKRGEKESELG